MSHPRAFFTICLVVCYLLLLVPAVLAGISEPVIALHAKAHTTKGVTICGTWAPNDLDCTQFNIAGYTGVPYDVYVIGVNPTIFLAGDSIPSVGGVRFAIDYDGYARHGADVFSWISCGDFEFPWEDWPKPRTGNSLGWSPPPYGECHVNQPGDSGAQAVAGAFYVYAYSADIFSIAPFYTNGGSGIPVLEFADCLARNRYLDLETARGAVRFSEAGTAIGFNPCTGEGELPPYGPPEPPVPPPPPPTPTGEHSAAILLHVSLAGDRGGSCADAPSTLDSVKTSAPYSTPGTLYDVFLLATPEVPHDPVGIGGIQMGIEYSPSVQMQSWISCGVQLPYGDWPASGSGNMLIFDGCGDEIEVGGYFQVAIYDPSLFRIVGHPATGLAKWADCSGTGDRIFQDLTAAQAGWISLGGAAIGQDNDGCNPALESCAEGPVPGRPITWGKLKTKY